MLSEKAPAAPATTQATAPAPAKAPTPAASSVSTPAPVTAPAPKPAEAPPKATTAEMYETRSLMFDVFDENHDGFVTWEEFSKRGKGQPNLEARFKGFDKKGAGKFNREDYCGPAPKPSSK
ncbi:MAG: hypothetical protein EBR81_03375 [Proteobacteria bacterium]|jgi:hypothetical protein|nr:hypothetical protein [Pseudomonadota bacterium]